jgi:ABC-type multidrug transport system fused ATPase/permease subunit
MMTSSSSVTEDPPNHKNDLIDEEKAVGTELQPSIEMADGSSKSTAVATTDHDKDESDHHPSRLTSAPPSLLRLLSVATPEMPALFVAVLMMIATEAITLVNPMIIAQAYDVLVDDDNDNQVHDINRVMLIVLVLHGAGIVAGFLRYAIMGIIGERLVARLRNQLYSAILNQEIAFFDEHKSGELVSRLGSDTTLLQTATSHSMPEFLLGVVKLFVSVGLMFWISLKLAGLTIGSVIVIFFIAVPFGRVIGKLSKSYQDQLGLAQTRSTECLGAMRTVQSFAAEGRERQRYQDKIGNPDDFPCWCPTTTTTTASPKKKQGNAPQNDEDDDTKTTYSVGFAKAIWNSAFFSFIFGFGFAAMYASLWYGFTLVTNGDITLGELTAFQSYIFQIGFGLAGTSGHLTKVMEALGASGRIFFLLDRVPTIPTPPVAKDSSSSGKDTKQSSPPPPPPPLRPKSMEGAVTIKDVTFAYPSRPNVPVLENFSLSVPPNTIAALVGSSGAGKSTVVSLLQRFYDVNSGSIMIDGHDIRSLDLQWLRRHIGYVQQEPSLFGLTIRENICYGVTDRDVSQEELDQVCREANAHDFIMNWPNGYDTLVGERGT